MLGSVRDHQTYICKYEILADFDLAVAKVDHQTVKFNSLPKFPAISIMHMVKGCQIVCTQSVYFLYASIAEMSSRDVLASL